MLYKHFNIQKDLYKLTDKLKTYAVKMTNLDKVEDIVSIDTKLNSILTEINTNLGNISNEMKTNDISINTYDLNDYKKLNTRDIVSNLVLLLYDELDYNELKCVNYSIPSFKQNQENSSTSTSSVNPNNDQFASDDKKRPFKMKNDIMTNINLTKNILTNNHPEQK